MFWNWHLLTRCPRYKLIRRSFTVPRLGEPRLHTATLSVYDQCDIAVSRIHFGSAASNSLHLSRMARNLHKTGVWRKTRFNMARNLHKKGVWRKTRFFTSLDEAENARKRVPRTRNAVNHNLQWNGTSKVQFSVWARKLKFSLKSSPSPVC